MFVTDVSDDVLAACKTLFSERNSHNILNQHGLLNIFVYSGLGNIKDFKMVIVSVSVGANH